MHMYAFAIWLHIRMYVYNICMLCTTTTYIRIYNSNAINLCTHQPYVKKLWRQKLLGIAYKFAKIYPPTFCFTVSRFPRQKYSIHQCFLCQTCSNLPPKFLPSKFFTVQYISIYINMYVHTHLLRQRYNSP